MNKMFDSNNNPYFECPVCDAESGSIVVHVRTGEEDFWGCGDCGSVWFSEEELLEL